MNTVNNVSGGNKIDFRTSLGQECVAHCYGRSKLFVIILYNMLGKMKLPGFIENSVRKKFIIYGWKTMDTVSKLSDNNKIELQSSFGAITCFTHLIDKQAVCQLNLGL